MKPLWIAVLVLAAGIEAFAHGRSPEMVEMLNAPVPEWMSLAEPIKVEPVEEKSLTETLSFRSRSGGATNSRNRVQIPERGIEFQVDYPIAWENGSSLNSDGTKLLVNSGTIPPVRLYNVLPSGHIQEVPIRLPQVTHDAGLKGFITGWSWAGDDIVIGRSGITDEPGHLILESRLYVFHLKEQALARLDLGAVAPGGEDVESVEVLAVGDDLEHLRLRVGGRELVVKADLKSPPRLLAKPESGPLPSNSSADDPTADRKSSDATASVPPAPESESPAKSAACRWVAAFLLALLGLLWWFARKRRGKRGNPGMGAP